MQRFIRLIIGKRSRINYTKDIQRTIIDKIIRLILIFFVVLMLHTVGMVYFEGLDWGDATWLSLTTANTTGYGDFSATTFMGRLTTTVLMYGIGITLLAIIAGESVEYLIEKRERKLKGLWDWKMKDHILIIKTPNLGADRYLIRLATQIRNTPSLANLPVQILSSKFETGLPSDLSNLNVVHSHATSYGGDELRNAGVAYAKYIFVIAEGEQDSDSDAKTFDILDRIQEIGTQAKVVAETVVDENRNRFKRAGACSVIRPIRAYPELAVRAMSSPGTEQVLEDMFDHKGDHPERYEVELRGQRWVDIVCHCVQQGFGIALGYVNFSGEIVTNPAPQDAVSGSAIILLVHHRHKPAKSVVRDSLSEFA